MKSKKKKGCLFVLIGFAAIILVMVIVMLLNPLRRSEERIREDLLKITPIGMSIEEVRRVIIRHHKWKIDHIFQDSGYLMIGGSPSGPHFLVDKDDERYTQLI
jgi:hypothetical protein